MGFVIKQSDSYAWPVTLEVPGDGRHEKFTFDVEFKRVGQTRINELVKGGTEGLISDRQTCEELVVGWKGVSDDNGDLAFSQKALASVLDIAGVERAIVVAWIESLSGAKRKN